MSGWLKSVLNPYDRRARVEPALFCGIPLIASIVLLIPELGAMWGLIGGVVVYCGGSMLLVQIGRDRGKALENRLFLSWGGKPSMAMLRHSDTRLIKPTKDRYRTFLSTAVPDLTLASRKEEQENPKQADSGYDSANSWLLEQTRNHARFALLFTENMNYGFRRNVYALKPIAFAVQAIALLIVIGVVYDAWTGQFATTIQAISPECWASLVVTAVHNLLFVAYIRIDWVRAAAEAYAQQLLAACDSLEREIHT